MEVPQTSIDVAAGTDILPVAPKYGGLEKNGPVSGSPYNKDCISDCGIVESILGPLCYGNLHTYL